MSEVIESAEIESAEKAKPTHYRVLCISMYTADIERSDALIEEMKARGFTKANRSALIRLALRHLDLDVALFKESPL